VKAILPTHLDRISPLLDTARHALIVEVSDGAEVGRSEETLPGDGGAAQCKALITTGADRLICGAISGRMMSELMWHGVQIWPGVAGGIEDVIASLISRGAPGEAFRMPGCGGHGRGRGQGHGHGQGRRRHCWGWQSAGGGVGEEIFDERKARD
jgi:predicted Fe-Mo cluster-binding NifX family protein